MQLRSQVPRYAQGETNECSAMVRVTNSNHPPHSYNGLAKEAVSGAVFRNQLPTMAEMLVLGPWSSWSDTLVPQFFWTIANVPTSPRYNISNVTSAA